MRPCRWKYRIEATAIVDADPKGWRAYAAAHLLIRAGSCSRLERLGDDTSSTSTCLTAGMLRAAAAGSTDWHGGGAAGQEPAVRGSRPGGMAGIRSGSPACSRRNVWQVGSGTGGTGPCSTAGSRSIRTASGSGHHHDGAASSQSTVGSDTTPCGSDVKSDLWRQQRQRWSSSKARDEAPR